MENKLKLLFLGVNWFRKKEPLIPINQACLISALRGNFRVGEELEVYVKNFSQDIFAMEVIRSIYNILPDIIAIGVYIWNKTKIKEILQILHQIGFTGKILLGGPEITYSDQNIIEEYPLVHYYIKGEGESQLIRLIRFFLETRRNNPIIANDQLLEFAKDSNHVNIEDNLSILPSPYLTSDYPIQPNQQFVRWQTARGYPFSCSYCCHHITTKVRYFPITRLLKEINLFCERNVKEIMVLDPIFNLKKSHYTPLLDHMIEKQISSRLELQCRLEYTNQAFLTKVEKLNDVHLEFGLQTINTIEAQAINRRNNLEKVNTVLKRLEIVNSHMKFI